jgi:hypothetical protein
MDERTESSLSSIAPLAALGAFFCDVCLIQLI